MSASRNADGKRKRRDTIMNIGISSNPMIYCHPGPGPVLGQDFGVLPSTSRPGLFGD